MGAVSVVSSKFCSSIVDEDENDLEMNAIGQYQNEWQE